MSFGNVAGEGARHAVPSGRSTTRNPLWDQAPDRRCAPTARDDDDLAAHSVVAVSAAGHGMPCPYDCYNSEFYRARKPC
jgi:hypothetical protein